MSSSVTDFLNTSEINADAMSGVITSGNLDVENQWYRAVLTEAEVLRGVLRRQLKQGGSSPP